MQITLSRPFRDRGKLYPAGVVDMDAKTLERAKEFGVVAEPEKPEPKKRKAPRDRDAASQIQTR